MDANTQALLRAVLDDDVDVRYDIHYTLNTGFVRQMDAPYSS